jgi:long-chain acyl-CoA synthetase
MTSYGKSLLTILPRSPSSLGALPIFLIECILFVVNVITLPIFVLIDRPFTHLAYTNAIRAVKRKSEDGSYTYWTVPEDFKLPECKDQWAVFQQVWTQTRHIGELLPALAAKDASKSLLGIRLQLKDEPEANNNKKTALRLANEYTWFNVAQVNREAQRLAIQLQQQLNVRSGDRVALLLETCPQWYVTVHALYSLNAIPITLYASLGEEALIHALNQSQPSLIVTESTVLLSTLRRVHRTIPDRVQRILCVRDLQTEPCAKWEHQTDTQFAELYHCYVDLFSPFNAADDLCSAKQTLNLPDFADSNLALLMYTSGSTGLSKAVTITHRQLINSLRVLSSRVLSCYQFDGDEQETYLAYLPMAHILEFLCELAFSSFGVRLAYGRATTLFPNPRTLHPQSHGDLFVSAPTIMTAVPLVLERVRSTIRAQISQKGVWKLALLELLARQRDGWRSLGFDCYLSRQLLMPIKRKFGGRLRLWMSGGASLSENTQRFVQSILDVQVLQGYASTECTGAALIQDPLDRSVSQTGAPLHGVRLRLEDWEEGKKAISAIRFWFVTCSFQNRCTHIDFLLEHRRLSTHRFTFATRRDSDWIGSGFFGLSRQ